MDDLQGRTLKGYQYRECIGAGGFGMLYRAYQPVIDREVAIKVILPAYANQPDFIRRFEAEAQLVARLEHPFIVPLFDYWRDPSGAYLVMRYLRGGNLRQALSKGPLPLETVIRLLEQIASALATAHRSNVVHRDVKPENILLDEYGNAYLSDFGIAQVLDRAPETNPEDSQLTGSPAYISPEQITGLTVRPQSDIYGLGVVLYEMVTGNHPFVGTPLPQMLVKHLTERLPDLRLHPGLPEAIDLVIQKATEKDPMRRYEDALALVDDFRAAVGLTAGSIVSAMADFYAPFNPYKGLRPFEEADAADYFGRDALINHLLAQLAADDPWQRFLAVVGPSGSGKSSMVKAGLLPRLRRHSLPGSGSWFIAEMVPGAEPLKALESALLSVAVTPPAGWLAQLRLDGRALLRAVDYLLGTAASDLLLVIDQFEELFSLVADEEERNHFLDLLYTAVTEPGSRLRVVVTLRADFTDRPLQYAGLGELMRRRTEFVLPLAPEEIEQAITGPAARAGLQVDPDLLATIVADVRDEPGALPLLQHTLTELFERREGRRLTLAAYRDSGGVLGSLARRAEDVYQSLTAGQQAAARQLFLRLISLGAGQVYTRRRARRLELTVVDSQVLADVLEAFGRYRLLTFDRDLETREPTVEVAHEALLHEWDRLRRWLEQSRQDLHLQHLLATAAAEWQAAQRDHSFLLAGTRLSQFETWAADTDLALTEEEQAYLSASVAERKAREAQEWARRTRIALLERRSRNFLRLLAVVLLVMALGGFSLAAVAFRQRQEARANFARAESQRLAAESARVLQGGRSPELAALLAIQALKINYTTQADLALQSAARFYYGEQLLASGVGLSAVALSPDTRLVAAGNEAGRVHLWDISAGREVARWPVGDGQSVYAVAFSPDGRYLLTGSDDVAQLWQTATGEEIRRLPNHGGPVYAVAFARDGRTFLTGGGEAAHVWESATGAEWRRITLDTNNLVTTAAFAPDGRLVVTGSYDGVVRLWSVATGQLVREFRGHTNIIDSVAFTSNGRYIVSSAEDNTARLWDATTGVELRQFIGHTDLVYSVAFSPNNRYVLSGSWDTTARLWDVTTGAEMRRLSGHTAAIFSVAFSSDGRYAVTASQDGTARIWDIRLNSEPGALVGHEDWINDIAFSPDGRAFVTAGDDGMVHIWDAIGGVVRHTLRGHTNQVVTAGFTAGGRTVLTSSLDGTTRLWDSVTGTELRRYPLGRAAALSPDGSQVLAASVDRTAALLDAGTGEIIHTFDEVSGAFQVAYAPDGRSLLVATSNGAQMFDAHTFQPGHFLVQAGLSSVAYSPDGRFLVAASQMGAMQLWDVLDGTVVRSFAAGHSTRIWQVTFSNDGRTVLTAGEDGTARLWDVATGLEVRRFAGHRGAVGAAAFSPDGRTVILGSADGVVISTAAAYPDLITDVCRRVLRDLAADERMQYEIDANRLTCP